MRGPASSALSAPSFGGGSNTPWTVVSAIFAFLGSTSNASTAPNISKRSDRFTTSAISEYFEQCGPCSDPSRRGYQSEMPVEQVLGRRGGPQPIGLAGGWVSVTYSLPLVATRRKNVQSGRFRSDGQNSRHDSQQTSSNHISVGS